MSGTAQAILHEGLALAVELEHDGALGGAGAEGLGALEARAGLELADWLQSCVRGGDRRHRAFNEGQQACHFIRYL